MLNIKEFPKGKYVLPGNVKAEISTNHTKPPPKYNEGSLLIDMKSAAKFITDKNQRDALKNASGIGTPATRSAIIEDLKKTNMLLYKGKTISASADARKLINQLPPELTNPGTTAIMESILSDISKGIVKKEEFENLIVKQIKSFVNKSCQVQGITIKGKKMSKTIKCLKCGEETLKLIPAGKSAKTGKSYNAFWVCDSCNARFSDNNGTPVAQAEKVFSEHKCPKCDSKLYKMQTKNGKPYYSCSNVESCSAKFWDNEGKVGNEWNFNK